MKKRVLITGVNGFTGRYGDAEAIYRTNIVGRHNLPRDPGQRKAWQSGCRRGAQAPPQDKTSQPIVLLIQA